MNYTKARRNLESELQSHCVKWFRLTFKKYAYLLFSVPNGAFLSGTKLQRIKQWNRLKNEGATKGVSDLILLIPNSKYHALCIEMKTTQSHSKQSKSQKEFETAVTKQGYKYEICKTFDDFQQIINQYLKDLE